MKKIFIFIIGIFSIFLFNNNVYAFTETEYDPSISIFDKYGYDLVYITNCNDYSIYYDSYTNNLTKNSSSSTKKLCTKNNTRENISLANIKTIFKYYIHISYQDTQNRNYDTYLVFINKPYIRKYMLGGKLRGILVDETGQETGLKGLIIRNWTGWSHISYVTSTANNNFHGSLVSCDDGWYCYTNLGGSMGVANESYFYNNENLATEIFREHPWFDIYNVINGSNEYTTIEVNMNFDLVDYQDNNNVEFTGTNGFNFNTDIDLRIPYQNYVMLIPKHNQAFASYFWTNSFFQYNYLSLNNGTYTFNEFYSVDNIGFSVVNEYANWSKWTFSFTQEQVENNIALTIYNHNQDNELYLKIKSSDFDYAFYNQNSSSQIINGKEYANIWNDLHEQELRHPTEASYNIQNSSSATSFLKDIPNYLSKFLSVFALIGTIFTTIFMNLATDLSAYLIILFGFMIIAIIIHLLK